MAASILDGRKDEALNDDRVTELAHKHNILSSDTAVGSTCEQVLAFSRAVMKEFVEHAGLTRAMPNGDQTLFPLMLAFNVEQVARALKCSVYTVEQRARDGDLPGLKYGVAWVFPPEALRARLTEKALAEAAERRAPKPPRAIAFAPPERRKPGRPRLPIPKL